MSSTIGPTPFGVAGQAQEARRKEVQSWTEGEANVLMPLIKKAVEEIVLEALAKTFDVYKAVHQSEQKLIEEAVAKYMKEREWLQAQQMGQMPAINEQYKIAVDNKLRQHELALGLSQYRNALGQHQPVQKEPVGSIVDWFKQKYEGNK